MNSCPECGGLLIEDNDEDSYSASQEPVGYYCAGCGWSTDLERDMDDREAMNEVITVWHKGHHLLVSRAVADRLKLSENQQIEDEALFWKIIDQNDAHMQLVLAAESRESN